MNNHQKFLQAIQEKKIIKMKFDSKEKGIIERLCVPFDFGPWRRNISPNPDRYHVYDLNSPEGKHNVSIEVKQLINIEITDELFNPADYVTWNDVKWFIKRDWGNYS